ncbi:hypothetical protein P7C70_g8930, partial [Phenoliferia sp. Uapishka_3]
MAGHSKAPPSRQASRETTIRSDSRMPSSSSIFSARRDGYSSEATADTTSNSRSHRSPRRSESRRRSPERSSAMLPGWYDKMLELEIENRELKKKIARLAGHSPRASNRYRSPSASPRTSPRKRRDVKPTLPRKSLPPPSPTQDDIDFPLGVTIEEANEHASVYWDSLKEAVTRSDGYPAELWEKMSTDPIYLNVAHKYKHLPPYLLTPGGKPMKGFPTPCADYAALHIVAGGVMDQLFVMGPLPRDQPHLDLMGLVFEHLIPAARNSTPGETKSRAIVNQLAPPHYVLPGGLATAMVVKYIGYHKEKHRKARLHRLERAEALLANGQRPPRKSSVKVKKPDPTYEFLRDDSHVASAASSDVKTPDEDTGDYPRAAAAKPHFVASGLPPSRDVVGDRVGGREAVVTRSPHGHHSGRTDNESGTEDATPFEATVHKAAVPTPFVSTTSDVKMKNPPPPAHAHSNGFVDLDETIQDVMPASKDGGTAVNQSPQKKPKNKKKKKKKDADTVRLLPL